MRNYVNRYNKSLLALPRAIKRLIAVFVDISLCIISIWLGLYLRLGEFVFLSGNLLWPVLISVLLALPIFFGFGLYREIFRFSGWPVILTVSRAIFVYAILYSVIITTIGINGVPRTIGIIQPLLLLFMVCCSRVFVRAWLRDGQIKSNGLGHNPRALVYGAGSAGRQLVSALNNSNDYKVVGYLDDDNRLHNHVLNRLPIYSPDTLPKIIIEEKITNVLLAIPSASRSRRNNILKKIESYPVQVRTLPSMLDLAEGRVRVSDIRELSVEDLLGRESVAPNLELLRKNINEKVVMITGAGGSIGSEICRQIIKLNPTAILLVEISEYSLYLIHSELQGQIQLDECGQRIRLVPLLASVQNEKKMSQIMSLWRPDTLYHAAAYKHVPLVEHNLTEGVKNNVFGTLISAKAAIKAKVKDFVLISTDKAVRPTNVMGASKRLAEICLQALFDRENSGSNTSCNTKFSMVRFGNVLGSSGSVIPRFRQQIFTGGPITLTHPEITRYFMTVTEAAQLVIQAGTMANGGDVFVLDMGEQIKIADLAKRMVELSGLTVCDEGNPNGDIKIELSGLRPGEKLYEELMLGDKPEKTPHHRILRAQDPFVKWQELEPDLIVFEKLLEQNDLEETLAILKRLVPGFKPSGEIVDCLSQNYINSNVKT